MTPGPGEPREEGEKKEDAEEVVKSEKTGVEEAEYRDNEGGEEDVEMEVDEVELRGGEGLASGQATARA